MKELFESLLVITNSKRIRTFQFNCVDSIAPIIGSSSYRLMHFKRKVRIRFELVIAPIAVIRQLLHRNICFNINKKSQEMPWTWERVPCYRSATILCDRIAGKIARFQPHGVFLRIACGGRWCLEGREKDIGYKLIILLSRTYYEGIEGESQKFTLT